MKKKMRKKEGQGCFKATKKFKRRVPIPQIRYVKKYWSNLYKLSLFGYGIVFVPITNMIYFYSIEENGTVCIKFWYAATIQEIISGNIIPFFED